MNYLKLFCLSMFLLLFKCTAADGNPTGKFAANLKIASFNLRCWRDPAPNDLPNRGKRIQQFIADQKWDIFGAQEVQPAHFPFVTNLNYHYIGEGRSDRGEKTEFSPVFYNPETLEMLSCRTFWLSLTPEVKGSVSWKSACTRICTYGIFRHKASGRKFVFVNTHLDNRSKEARLEGMKLIVKTISALPEKLPVIITGDFNDFPGSAPLKVLASKFTDASAKAAVKNITSLASYHGYKADPTARRDTQPIDYIFVNDMVKVNSFKLADNFKNGLSPSDHFPVEAEIMF